MINKKLNSFYSNTIHIKTNEPMSLFPIKFNVELKIKKDLSPINKLDIIRSSLCGCYAGYILYDLHINGILSITSVLDVFIEYIKASLLLQNWKVLLPIYLIW
jgi:hypothetical protein